MKTDPLEPTPKTSDSKISTGPMVLVVFIFLRKVAVSLKKNIIFIYHEYGLIKRPFYWILSETTNLEFDRFINKKLIKIN